jgi:hypothetical protein
MVLMLCLKQSRSLAACIEQADKKVPEEPIFGLNTPIRSAASYIGSPPTGTCPILNPIAPVLGES